MVENNYDDGRLTSESLIAGGITYLTTYQYNNDIQVTKLTYPDGSTVDRTYTDRHQLHETKWNNALVNTRAYDAGGRLITSTDGNGVISNRTYRNDNLLTAINSTAVGNYSYDWDANKNKISETITGPLSGYGFGASNSTVYDADDRLTTWNRTDGSLDHFWSLSAVGDWDDFKTNGVSQYRAHNAAHEVAAIGTDSSGAGGTSVSHDAKGNLTSNENGDTYTWDFDNRLASALVGSKLCRFEYDATGRRITLIQHNGDNANSSIDKCTRYAYSNQQVVCEYDIPKNNPVDVNAPVQRYVYAAYVDEPILKEGQFDGGGSGIVYYSHNQQYSITALTNVSGSVVEHLASGD